MARFRDLRSRKRAGREVRRMLRKEMRASAHRNWKRLTVVLVGWLAFSAAVIALAAWLTSEVIAASSADGAHAAWSTTVIVVAFLVGLSLGTIPFLWQAWTIAAGFAHRAMGGVAEQWTADELVKLDDRAWTIVHDVPLSRSNVDHVAIGPGRVYAIETKWMSTEPRWLDGCARQAERQADELAALMAGRGAGRDVIPLLVVWGPEIARVIGEKLEMNGRTRVVAGAHPEGWLQRMTDAADRLEIDWAAQRAVLAVVEEFEAGATQVTPGTAANRQRPVPSST